MDGCKGKKAYNSEKNAITSANAQRERKGRHLRAYLCFNCMKWHLSSMPTKQYLKKHKYITK